MTIPAEGGQAKREMSLGEFVETLPTEHRARKEYEKLKAQLTMPIYISKGVLVEPSDMYPGKIAPADDFEIIILTFQQYMRMAMRTLSGPSGESQVSMLNTAALGFGGEGGEFMEHIKKLMFHGHPLDRAKLSKELGDILWYWALACYALDLDPESVAWQNIMKLKDRYPERFETERSLNKDESKEAQG
jgi:NTP pyrophosphatase (non-canonical NTP hydrolase)